MDENSNPPSVADKSVLDSINPMDHHLVHTRAESRWYEFDYTDTATVVDGDTVLSSTFMPGCWKVRP